MEKNMSYVKACFRGVLELALAPGARHIQTDHSRELQWHHIAHHRKQSRRYFIYKRKRKNYEDLFHTFSIASGRNLLVTYLDWYLARVWSAQQRITTVTVLRRFIMTRGWGLTGDPSPRPLCFILPEPRVRREGSGPRRRVEIIANIYLKGVPKNCALLNGCN